MEMGWRRLARLPEPAFLPRTARASAVVRPEAEPPAETTAFVAGNSSFPLSFAVGAELLAIGEFWRPVTVGALEAWEAPDELDRVHVFRPMSTQ